MKKKFTLFYALFFIFFTAHSQSQIVLTPFATGLTNPVNIAHAGNGRLFVVEREGKIRIVDSTGALKATAFLDISNRVVAGSEQGLLGLAFHPQYASNKYFYVDYTGVGDSTHISRFTANAANADMADITSEIKLMTIYQPFKNHNGGHIAFGPDGFLYIGMGDGGDEGDPGNRAQDSTQLLGKLLRIDVNGGTPYAIPPSNPFIKDSSAINNTNIKGEIWAMGLRNPWRFSFDRTTKDLLIADVGQDKFEEINFQPASDTGGRNYGWRCYEGNSNFNTEGCNSAQSYTSPIFVYPHLAGACSVTGGYVYRGSKYPSLVGRYFFADYCNGMLGSLTHGMSKWDTAFYGQYNDYSFSTFGEDAKGELYIASLTKGIIYHITSNTPGDALRDDSPQNIKIYPNPFVGNVNIEIKDQQQAYLMLFDLQGRMIYEKEIKTSTEIIDLSWLKSGMYLLQIKMNGVSKFEKIIKK